MSSASARELPRERAAQPVARTHQIDPLLSSLFLGAASLILALQNPIYLEFRPRPVETLVLCSLGIVLLVTANIVRSIPLLVAGSVTSLLVVAAGTMSQPVSLIVPLFSVWPLRLGVILLVTAAWALLLQPPTWARRALLSFFVPTGLLLLYWILPPILYPALGFRLQPVVNNKFPPYWLAVDRHGNTYATDLNGKLVWVFDSAGQARGTLQPIKAPPVATPGPGVSPLGFGNEEASVGSNLVRGNPTAVIRDPAQVPRAAIGSFDFCGIAVDERDNLYLADLFDPTGYKLLRFDLNGNITARWPLPLEQLPTNDCLAVDSEFIYISVLERGQLGLILVLDHDGNLLHEIELPYLPLSLSAQDSSPLGKTNGKTILVMGQSSVHRIDVRKDGFNTRKLFDTSPAYQVPILLTSSGEVLLTNRQEMTIGRFDPNTGELLGTWGRPGIMPGTFGDVGSIVEDRQGRIYISDPINRVIHRAEPDGTVTAVMWAPMFGIPPVPVEID